MEKTFAQMTPQEVASILRFIEQEFGKEQADGADAECVVSWYNYFKTMEEYFNGKDEDTR